MRPDRPDPRAVWKMVKDLRPESQAHGGDRRSKGWKPHESAVSKVARELGLGAKGRQTVSRLAKIGRNGTDELLEALRQRRVSLIDATRIAGLAKGASQLKALATFLKLKGDQKALFERAVRFEPEGHAAKLAPQRYELAKDGRPRPIPTPPFMAVTFTSTKTCSTDCPFKKRGGCYAQSGPLGYLALPQVDTAGLMCGALPIISHEAKRIEGWIRGRKDGVVPDNGAGGKRDLRLHEAGDIGGSALAAKWLARAADAWIKRGGNVPFTFTHDWRIVPRRAWGKINVLASVETPDEIAEARERGYAAFLTVAVKKGHFQKNPGAYEVAPNTWAVPCPAQSPPAGATKAEKAEWKTKHCCVRCRLCIRPEYAEIMLGKRGRKGGPRIFRAIVIGTHGPGKKKADAAIRRKLNRRK